jgi:hypothetical protein|tara:strand:- start:56 stop:307 length:252 start_codon:yes stop_codon:yes gene_type:complete
LRLLLFSFGPVTYRFLPSSVASPGFPLSSCPDDYGSLFLDSTPALSTAFASDGFDGSNMLLVAAFALDGAVTSSIYLSDILKF